MRVIEQTSFLAFTNFPRSLILWTLMACFRRVVDLGNLKNYQEEAPEEAHFGFSFLNR